MRFANRTDVHTWFLGTMDLLELIGRLDEAITVGQYWINRDPYCGNCLGRVARAMSAAGRHEEAALIVESQLERREATGTMFWNLGVMFLTAGNPRKALHFFDRMPDDDPMKQFARAFALYSLGRFDEFESFLEQRLSSHPDESAEGIARLYAWSNQRDEAFEWLEKMIVEKGEESARFVKTELYEPIKSDPRWQEFLERYGVEDKGRLNIKFEPRYPPTLQRAVDALTAP
jgi:tetratricopeptide (TPR) repeat protein